jgi:DNA-binding transcriptional MerR regulator
MSVITEVEPITQADDCQGLYPIRDVARLTGINPVTLRAWERRYGLIEPKRTESGHRLYSVSDIESIRLIMGWLERGVAVSKVAQLLANTKPADNPQPEASEYGEWQTRISSALAAFNESELERLYGQIYSSYPVEVVFQRMADAGWILARAGAASPAVAGGRCQAVCDGGGDARAVPRAGTVGDGLAVDP